MLQRTPACCHQASCGCAPFYHVAAAAPAVLAVLPAAAGDAAGAADVGAAVNWPFAVQPAAAAGHAASPARKLSKWCSGTSGDASATHVTLHTCAQVTQLLETFLPVQPPLYSLASSQNRKVVNQEQQLRANFTAGGSCNDIAVMRRRLYV